MLQRLQWPTLQEHIAQAKVFMMYRMVYIKPPDTNNISERHNEVPNIPYARSFMFTEALLPGQHQNVEQPSPDSSNKLLDAGQLQRRIANANH